MKRLYFFLLIFLSVSLIFTNCNDKSSDDLNLSVDAQYVSVLEHGAVGDGIANDTDAIQALLDDSNVNSILLKEDYVFICTSLSVPSNKTIIINGTLRVMNTVYTNEVHTFIRGAGAVSNIKITGSGTIDGNPNLTSGYFSLIYFDNSNDIEVSNLKLKDNRFPNAVDPKIRTSIIKFNSSDDIKVHNLTISNWGREGIWLENCDFSSVTDINMDGHFDSYSGIQVQGENNIVSSCIVKNAGASSFGFDSKYSSISNCISVDNRVHNGFNFGHLETSLAPASPTQNCLISNCISRGSAVHGFNFTAGGDENQIVNCISEGAEDSGFYFADGEHFVQNVSAKNGKVGLKINKSFVSVVNADFRENSVENFHVINDTARYDFTNVRLSNDPFQGAIDLVNYTSSGSYPGVTRTLVDGVYYYTIPNGNIRKQSKIRIEPVHKNSTLVKPFIREINNTFIKVGVVGPLANPAWVRFYVD